MKRRVVLDTNCLLQSVSSRSAYYPVWEDFVLGRYVLCISTDVDDNKFVDCAVVANADFIVTEDSHFRVLKSIPFPKVRVKRLQEFCSELLSAR